MKLPDRTPDDFDWQPNGRDFTNCPGGYVIREHWRGDFGGIHYRDSVVVFDVGQPIQFCESVERAKQYVVSCLRAHAEAYLAAGGGA